MGYGYDNDYRLTSEAITGDPGGNNGTVSYTNYDAVGNRTQMTSTLGAVPGGSFFYDANDRLSGAVTRTYADGLQRVSENQLVGSTWTPSFYGYDGHGNVRFLTNVAGAVTDTYQYDAFGMPIASSGTTANSFHYSGEWLDSSIGWYQLRDRWYNYAIGRFETQDPYEGEIQSPAKLHKYVYTGNNPVNFVDPTGDEAVDYTTLTFRVFRQTVRVGYPLGQCINKAFGSEGLVLDAVVSGSATDVSMPGR